MDTSSQSLAHFPFWHRVDLLPGSGSLVAERTGSAGLLAGCCVDLPVHAALYTNGKNALDARIGRAGAFAQFPNRTEGIAALCERGKSKDPRLHFGHDASNLRLTTLAACPLNAKHN